jgi:hypothetical protein
MVTRRVSEAKQHGNPTRQRGKVDKPFAHASGYHSYVYLANITAPKRYSVGDTNRFGASSLGCC